MPVYQFRAVVVMSNGDTLTKEFDLQSEAFEWECKYAPDALFHGTWRKKVGSDDSTYHPIRSYMHRFIK